MKSSSGRLLGIDLQTKKNFKMQLDGEENNMAIATNDGKYLIAIKSILMEAIAYGSIN